jgi:glucosamine--fructose-6-phosphate aminotransferase (isomerizing)
MIRPESSTLMFAEAAEAGAIVAAQLDANRAAVAALGAELRSRPPRGVLTFARGSSDHAATFAKYLIETRLGILTTSASPSVASVYGSAPDAADMLALAISQSGRSPDILAAAEAAQRSGARLVVLVNDEDSPLARMADVLLPLRAGQERSVAATKSYIASLAAVVQLVAGWAKDKELGQALANAPGLLRTAWEADWSAVGELLSDARGLYAIGRGLGLAVAHEAALKFKETCGLHAEAFSAAEVRHGPMALIGPDFPLLVFRQSDATGDGTDAFVAAMVGEGNHVLVASSSATPGIRLPTPAAHPAIEPLLQIQSFYRAANALALRRGFDPDRPRHLAKVTETL